MSRKRAMVWAVAVVVGLTARTVVAAPRAAVTELRAAACCAEHCPTQPRRPMTPHRCCFLESPAADPASAAPATALGAPHPSVLALAVLPAVPAVASRVSMRTETSVRAGPPRYLQSLRLRL